VDSQRRVYVADRANARVQVFDENGKFLAQWRNIRSPYSIHIDKDDAVWVGDGDTHKIVKYNTDGEFQYAWGTYGHWPGGLWSNHQLSVDQEGNLYIADVFFHRVQKFRPQAGAEAAKLVGIQLGRQ
jgi:DNA-binding beta-propeller fold protein YncE